MEQLYGMIRMFEGLYLNSYLCPAGVPTIGYGSTGPDIRLGLTWTLEQAEERMRQEADTCIREAKALCPSLQDGALVAVADFVYNLGASRLKASTLRKRINAGDMDTAKAEILRWNKAGGKILRGLVIRRAAESRLLT